MIKLNTVRCVRRAERPSRVRVLGDAPVEFVETFRCVQTSTRYIALYRSVKTVGGWGASTVLRLEILPRTNDEEHLRLTARTVGLKTGSADGSHRVATRNTAPGGFRLNLGRSPIRPDGAIAPRSVSTFRVRLLGNF